MKASAVAAGALTLACLGATATQPTLSAGGSFGGDESDGGQYGFDVVQEEPGATGEVTTAGDGGEPAPEPHAVFSFPVLDTDPTTGEPCQGTRYAVADTPAEAQAASSEARARADAYYTSIDPADPPPPCDGVTIDLGEPPRIAAQRIADTLAPAAPFVQPDNRAITGIWSYLTTNIDSDFSDTVTVTLFGQDWLVDVDVVGEHTIDWGDGTVTTATGDGGPWHEGEPGPDDIAHGYIDTGDHSLVVTTDWTVTATLRATGTTATQSLSTTSDPVTIDVDEVRSVRDS